MITIMDLDQAGHRSCRWILQTQPVAFYCGAPARTKSSYCDHHHAKSWTATRRQEARKPTMLPKG